MTIFRQSRDDGSVLPLVLGMVVCLLLLGAGVTAATSAFLSHQRVQHTCDGAAASAASAAKRSVLLDSAIARVDSATAAAGSYVRVRHPATAVSVEAAGGDIALECRARAPITFGALFGVGEMTVTVHAAGHAVLAANGR